MCLDKQAALHGTSLDAGSRHDSRCSRGERPGHLDKRPEAGDYASATALSHRLAGDEIPRQAFAFRAKILQIDRRVPHTRHRVVEVHPEANFAQLAGAPLHSLKSARAGMAKRPHLLTEAGSFFFPDDLGPAGEKAAIDDVLGGAVAAWTPVRVI
jgi:predicted RNase H-like nuclease